MSYRSHGRPGGIQRSFTLTMSLLLLGAGLPLLPWAATAAGAERAPLFSPPGQPPGSISVGDRTPVISVPDENGVRDPRQVPVRLSTSGRPDQPPQAAAPLPMLGGPNFNVFGLGPDGAAHVAQVFPQNVNARGPNGAWTDVRSDLKPESGHGWQATVLDVTSHFPTTLSVDTPVRVDLAPGAALSVVPENVAPVAGREAGGVVTYPNARSQTDLVYRPALGGYEEDVVLNAPQAPGDFSYLVDAPGLSLQMSSTGEVEVVAGGTAIARMVRPVAFDASADAASSVGSLSLQDLGSGRYRIRVTVDKTFLAKATYPVTVDPGFQRIYTDTSDTWVNSASPDTDYSSTNGLWVVSGTSTGHAFLRFNTTGLQRSGRIVYDANMQLYIDSGTWNGPMIDASRVTSAWPTPLKWNTQPTAGGVIYSRNCPVCSGWMGWQLKSMYQHILDPANPDPWTDEGVRMSTSGTATYAFYSANSILSPFLDISYNDLPDAPSISFPRDNYVSENDSPTLKIGAIPSDPNGDEVLVQYQLSDDPNDFTGNHLIWESPWTDERSYVVPSGILVDGQTYHWRARSWDICAQPDGMCSLTDGQGVTRQQNASATRAITIVLKHFGDDPRWAMWSHDLGNGMTAKVNEANGNLFLDVPLDTLATAVGDLSVGLSYNSQQNANLGLTPGWDLAIGPEASARDLPKELVKLGDPTDFPDAGLKVRLGGGRAVFFPHRERRVFASVGPGAGVIKQNSDGTFLYTTADGSTYTFKANGKLIEANPAASQLASGANSLDYTFNASDELTRVTDPKGRTVDVTWTSGRPSAISTWAGQTWNLSYAGGHLDTVSVSVTNPSTVPSPTTVTETVGFSYNANGLLSEIDDGVTTAANRTGWQVSYVLDPKGNHRVSTITAPGGGAPTAPTPWNFEYAGPYFGSTASTTCVTDPLDTPAAQLCTGAHQTKVDFNTAGLPIRIAGPADQTGYWPVTTTIWDSNGNMVCKRTPAANAASLITDATGCKNDARSTRWTYNNDAPFQMETETHPAPNSNGTGARLLESYQYDADTNGANYNGLWVEKFGNGNRDFTGVPADEAVFSDMNANWGVGTPPGVPGGGDNWSMRWSGLLDVSSWSAARRVAFRVTTADEGVTLIVGNTALLDCVGTTQPAGTYNCGTNEDKTKKLWPGLRPITIEYAELTGNASFKLEWDQGNGNWQVIPANKLQTNRGLLTKKTAKDAAATPDLVKTVYSFPDDDSKARHLPDHVAVTDIATGEVRKTAYTYNQFGQVTSITTAAGTALSATTTNIYSNNDTTSCLTQVTGPTGAVTNYTCNAAGDVTTATQVVRAVPGTNQNTAQNRITTTEYDSLGRVTKVIPPSGGYTITTYDRAGRVVNLDRFLGAGAGHDTHAYTDFTYDDAGHLLTERFPQVRDPASGQMVRPTITHTYDWLDEETERMDVRGKRWTYAYDAARRLIQTMSPAGLVSRTEYRLSTAPSGGTYQNRVTAWSPPGDPLLAGTVATVTTLDVLGQTTSQKVGTLTATTFTYDVLGNTTKATDPAGIRTDYTYNAFGQVTQRKDFAQGASAATTTNTYDAAGRQRTVDGPRTNADDSITYDYDAADRLTGVTQNGITMPGAGSPGVTTTYVWDDASERVQVRQPMSASQTMVRNWTFDTSGRMASYADTRGTTSYSYGAGDFLESVADPRGITLRFEYDNLGRRTRRYATSGAQVQDDQTFAFDLAGNIVSATVVGLGTIGVDYDDDGRMWKTYQQSATPTTTYSYNASTGRLASVVDPAGTTSFTYNANGQLHQLTEPFSSTPVTYGYDAAGRISTRTDGAGLCWTQTYEAATGRPDLRTVRVNGSSCNSTVLATFDLGYDPASNVTSRAETVKTETGANNPDSGTWFYGYDGAGRMTSSTAPSNTVTNYAYDGAGNRTSVQVGSGNPVTTTYDAAGLPTSSSNNTAYAHDAIGELTKIDRSGGTANDWNFVYDSWGNLKSAARKTTGAPDVSYTVDALDRVLTRTAGATATSYTYQGTGEDVAKAQVGTSTPVHYAFTSSGPLAQRTGTDNATLRYYVRDLHGDVVGMAATSGTNRMKGSILYSPWGEPGARTGESSTSPAEGFLGFQGDLTDASTGQVDMVTRLYEPTLGRFSSRDVLFGDPTTPLSLNQYVYGVGNPVTYTDPTGLRPECGDCTTRVEQKGLQLWADAQQTSGTTLENSVTQVHNQPEPDPVRPHVRAPNGCARRCGVVGYAATTTRISYSYVDDLQSEDCSNVFECAWWKIRASRNREFTTIGLAWAEANGATCIYRGQDLYVCGSTGAERLNAFADGPRGGVTIGNVYITEDDVFATLDNPDLLAHEAKHSDQWAVLGKAIVPIYLVTEAGAAILGTCGPLERLAGAEAGGYPC